MIGDQSQNFNTQKLQRVRHEINNALTALLGNTQMLLLRADLDEKSRGRVEGIEAQARRIRDLAAELKEE